MECIGGCAHSTWVISLEGAAAKGSLYCSLETKFPEQLPITTDPQWCSLEAYIGKGHMILPFWFNQYDSRSLKGVSQLWRRQGGLVGIPRTWPYLACDICGFRPVHPPPVGRPAECTPHSSRPPGCRPSPRGQTDRHYLAPNFVCRRQKNWEGGYTASKHENSRGDKD